MALKSTFSLVNVVDRPRECPECKEKGCLGFVNDAEGVGVRCDNCGNRFEFVAEPRLQKTN